MTPDYQHLWDTMQVTHPDIVKNEAAKILRNKETYAEVVENTIIPWQFVGIVHYRECDCDFTQHIHNGDSLKKRTVNVPSGRPIDGTPPFTWQESARDAIITLKHLDQEKDWSLPSILSHFERYNGEGYILYHPEVLSPYVWSYSSLYVKGKYASDGKFNPELVDQQCGCAPLYKFLTDKTLGLV